MSQVVSTSRTRSTDPFPISRRRRRSRMTVPLAGLAAAATVVTGCGGSGGSTGQSASPKSSPPTGAATTGQTIKTASVGTLGQILVDGQGRTVYLFQKDTGGKSSCYGACAGVWPPVTSSTKPQVGSGAMASLLGTAGRTDGTTQVTYAGHPLYYYAPDGTTSGSAKGQGLNQFGAVWYVMSPSGSAVSKSGGGY